MILLLKVTKNSVVIGYHVFLLKVLCLKPKPQTDGFFPRILHILGQRKYFSWRCRLLQASAIRGYHAVKKKPCYYMVQLWVVTMNLWILLQATGVKGYQVFLLQVICHERKPQIDGWILSVVHILGANIHRYSPKTKAINWRLHCMIILAVTQVKSWAKSAECWVLSAEYWVLSAECWVLSAECWVLSMSAECWVLSTGYYNLQLLEVTMYFHYKWYAKNGSHKLTAGFWV